MCWRCPWGFEIYGLLTRWNPLNVAPPAHAPYNGKNVLVVGLGPAGYTLAHHLLNEGFGVVAVDGLKIEPLDAALVGTRRRSARARQGRELALRRARRARLLGFGGVSEYGITVRWDKNFLDDRLPHARAATNSALRRHPLRRHPTLDDAWALGLRPRRHLRRRGQADPRRHEEQPVARHPQGQRLPHGAAADRRLQGRRASRTCRCSLPAVVIGGGLTAIDTATELLAYYLVQVEKDARALRAPPPQRQREATSGACSTTKSGGSLENLAHGAPVREENGARGGRGARARLPAAGRRVGRRHARLPQGRSQDSPAYRLNHEEVIKSLEEGVRYVEHMSPLEARPRRRAPHVKADAASRRQLDGTASSTLPARTVCVAAGTSPNIIYEKEYPGTFQLDDRKQYFRAARGDGRRRAARVTLAPVQAGRGLLHELPAARASTVSFYGDNHPHYAGSVVRAMASAKDGYPHVVRLFPARSRLDPATQPERDAKLGALREARRRARRRASTR